MKALEVLRTNVRAARTLAVRDEAAFERTDRLAAEEPMEIRVGGPGQDPAPVAVTMRTPGHDFELAAGFLFTEGLIRSRDDVHTVAYCELPAEEQRYNVVTVRMSNPFDPEAIRRSFYATSSCGICGQAEQIFEQTGGPARLRAVRPGRLASLAARGRGSAQRAGQAGGGGLPGGPAASSRDGIGSISTPELG